MSRPRRLHSEIKEWLRDLKSWAAAIGDLCAPPGLRFYPDAAGQSPAWHQKSRPRAEVRADEYLENDLARLHQVELYARGVIHRAAEIRKAALAQIEKLEAKQS